MLYSQYLKPGEDVGPEGAGPGGGEEGVAGQERTVDIMQAILQENTSKRSCHLM